jgi:hypothetical protein
MRIPLGPCDLLVQFAPGNESTPVIPQRQKPSPSVPAAGAEPLLSPRTAWIVAAVLAAGIFATYSPALNFEFILDDHHFIGDPRLQSSGHLGEYFTNYTWAQLSGGPLSFYRPLFVLWLRLNFLLAGMSPWGWHLLSIAKHVAVAVLLGLLVWNLLRDRVAALLAGTLFALHPAQTESVAWVTVPDPLMSAAVLGSLLLYLAYRARASAAEPASRGKYHKKPGQRSQRKPGKESALGWLIASSFACLAALLAKETAIVLPALLLFMALSRSGDKPWAEAGKGEGAGFPRLVSALRDIVPFIAVTAAYLLLRLHALQGRLSSETQHLPWRTVLLSWPATLWFYVKVLLWPVRSRAFADPILADSFSLRAVLLPGLGVCCALFALAWGLAWTAKRARQELARPERTSVERALLLGSLLLLLPLLPVLNLNGLNPGDFLHGRYTYLSLAGLMLLASTGWHLVRKGRVILLSAAAAVAFAFTLLTLKQESAWKNDLSVFTSAQQSAPHNAPVAQNLANAQVQAALGLDAAGRCSEAVPIFQQTINRYPNDWFAWAGLGECLVKLDDLPRAEQSLRRASELSGEPRVTELWQLLRAKMGLPPEPEK